MTLRTLAEHVKAGVREAGGVPDGVRHDHRVSDGISMGHEGMRGVARQPRGHLPTRSRRVMLRRAARRLRRPGRLRQVDAGDADGRRPASTCRACSSTTARSCPASTNGRALDITSVFEAVGACAAGTITEDELGEIERKACPGEGACGGMFTANTMSSIGEALGHERCPGSASPPAIDRRRDDDATARRRGGRRHAAARHHAARDHDQAGVRERDRPRRRRSAARPTPCCTCWRSPTRPASTLDLDDFNRIAATRAAHRRHEAGRQVPHERPRPRRRRAGRAQAPARRRAAARRRA